MGHEDQTLITYDIYESHQELHECESSSDEKIDPSEFQKKIKTFPNLMHSYSKLLNTVIEKIPLG